MDDNNFLVLVHAPLLDEANRYIKPVARTPNMGCLPPLGLIALATYLERENPSIQIRIIDGDLIGINEVKRQLTEWKPRLLGIGSQSHGSYPTAKELAILSKTWNAKVILGGEQASIRARQILENEPAFDFIVTGQGETAFDGILKNKPIDTIPNLAYIKGGKMHYTSRIRLRLNQLPIPDRKFIDLTAYSKNFQQTTESKLTGKKSFTTAKTQDGCMKAIKSGVCTFCKREDLLSADVRDPKLFWEEMMQLQEGGVDYVWEVSPSFSSVGLIYLEKLAEMRPPNCRIVFRVYARADDLANECIVQALKKIGVENALIGFESGNQKCLDSSNKGTTVEQNLAAARNLKKYGISTYCGFVLGHMAETYDSMMDTLHHAQQLKEILGKNLYRITTCSKLQLYPGTIEYNTFVKQNKEIQSKYDEIDTVDILELTERYFREYLHIDPIIADEIAEKIRALSTIKSGKDLIETTLSQ